MNICSPYFIWLVGEKCKPIIIRGADKVLHFIFPETISYLTIGKKRFYPFTFSLYQNCCKAKAF